MKIIFGLHIDREHHIDPSLANGSMRLGPLGLLERLELELGLTPIKATQADRVLAYRQCLIDVDSSAAFYTKSLKRDSLGVSRHLLGWRDAWYLGGWDGWFSEEVSESRLLQMHEVERLAKTSVQLGEGQRLRRLRDALGSSNRHQVQELILLDKYDDLPFMWRQVVEVLAYQETSTLELTPHASKGTDLYKVQQRLIETLSNPLALTNQPFKLNGDNTLFVFKSSSRDFTAQMIAESLKVSQHITQTKIVAEQDGIIIDNALTRCGMPRCGFNHSTRFRAISQVVRLAVGLLWSPIQPTPMLQFFIHPVAPLSDFVRRRFASVVAEEPGMEGDKWQELIEELTIGVNRESKDLLETINYWLMAKRYDSREGAPMTNIQERVGRCQNWLRARFEVESNKNNTAVAAMYRQAWTQTYLLAGALAEVQESGVPTIRKQELDRLMDEFIQATNDPSRYPEVGHVHGTSTSASIVEPYQQTIWWDIQSNTRRIHQPWDENERAILLEHGVRIESVEYQLERRAEYALRPIINTTSRFIAIFHPERSESAMHPLYALLHASAQNIQEFTVEASLDNETRLALEQLHIETQRIASRSLPLPKRFWHLAPQTIRNLRNEESYSSLSQLFIEPHRYVFNYLARLRSSAQGEILNEPILRGNITHKLIERFFNEFQGWQSLTSTEIDAFANTNFAKIIDECGATYNEPGQRSARIALQNTARFALQSLVRHLKSANALKVKPELRLSNRFDSFEADLSGMIDLHVETANRHVVVDVKSGGATFHLNELSENRHIQLATYSYLVKQNYRMQNWPYPAFFIVGDAQMLAPDRSVFPEARTTTAANLNVKTDARELWKDMVALYRWRDKQLKRGWVEVAVPATAVYPLEEWEAMTREIGDKPAGLLSDSEPDKFEPFSSLTGWRE